MAKNFLSKAIKNTVQRFGVRRYSLSGGTIGFDFTKFKFADAVFLSIIKKLLIGLQNTEYQLITNDLGIEKQKLFNSFKNIFEDNIEQVVLLYLMNGIVYFKRDKINNHLTLTNNEYEATYYIQSTTYKLYQKSDFEVLEDDLKHIDNLLNAVSTATERLGVLTILTPETSNVAPVMLREDDFKDLEKDIAKDYGILSNQTPIKVMRRKFDVNTINLAGANLRTNENLQTAVKIVCDVLEVPYEIVSSAIVGNPNQTGVYQVEAIKRLYDTVEKYVNVFVKFAEKDLNLKLDYTILTKPQDNVKTEWDAKRQVIETLNIAVDRGLVTPEQAKKEVNLYLNLD